jgi:hypothetical protein
MGRNARHRGGAVALRPAQKIDYRLLRTFCHVHAFLVLAMHASRSIRQRLAGLIQINTLPGLMRPYITNIFRFSDDGGPSP